jgi:hypothetical protein
VTEFDASDVHKFAAELGAAAGDVPKKMRPVVQRGALNIKKQMQAEASGHRRFPAFPASISYDTQSSRSEISAEIGPDKDKRQGALGNILYFGTVKNTAVLNINAPLDNEEPKFLKAIEDAIEGLL